MFTDFIKNYPEVINKNIEISRRYLWDPNSQKEIKSLKNINNSLLLEKDQLKKEVSNLKEKISKLQKVIEDLNNNIKKITKEKNTLTNKIKNLNIEFNSKNFDKESFSLMNKIEIKDSETTKKISLELKEGEELLTVIFVSIDENLNYSFICKNTDSFNTVENRLYSIFPEYYDNKNENCFYIKGKEIEKSKTIKENKIKYSDKIMLMPIKAKKSK